MNQIQVTVKDCVNPRFIKPGRLRTGFPQNSDVLLLKWYCTLRFMNPGLTLLKSIGWLVIFCYLQAAKKGLSSDLEKTCWDLL